MTTPKLSSDMARLPSKEMLDRNTTSVGYIMKAKAYHRTTPKPSSGGVRPLSRVWPKGSSTWVFPMLMAEVYGGTGPLHTFGSVFRQLMGMKEA